MRARGWWFAAAAAAAVIVARCGCEPRPRGELRIATFNIEDFPKSARQVEAAFDEIARLDAPIVAVQEIHDGDAFVAATRRRLGASWRFVEAVPGEPYDLGVVFDTRRFTLVSTHVYDETRLGSNHKPVYEVRLAPTGGDDDSAPIVRVLVVHFRCCNEGRQTRAAQHVALREIVRAAVRTGERVVVLGDFNATTGGDRADLAALARAAGLVWATEPLACSAFWDRDDGCPSSRLDHVLTWATPASVAAAGACATDGCAWHDRCPLYADEVSDHCPVVVSVPVAE